MTRDLGMRILFVVLVGVFLAGTAGADWLVRRDGRRIETRGQTVIMNGIVGYYDLEGNIQKFPVEELDVSATKLANLVAQRPAAKEHVVLDDSQVARGDAELTDAYREYAQATTSGAQEAALRKLNAALDRVGGPSVTNLRCGEHYADWLSQALCRMGQSTSTSSHWGPESLRDAVREFQCKRRFPRNAVAIKTCVAG